MTQGTHCDVGAPRPRWASTPRSCSLSHPPVSGAAWREGPLPRPPTAHVAHPSGHLFPLGPTCLCPSCFSVCVDLHLDGEHGPFAEVHFRKRQIPGWPCISHNQLGGNYHCKVLVRPVLGQEPACDAQRVRPHRAPCVAKRFQSDSA